MRLIVIDEAEIDAALDERIREGLCICFPPDVPVFSRTRYWHGIPPAFAVILEESERVIAHLAVVDRVITVGDSGVRVAGVQNVFVLPERRGQGLCGRVITAAMDEARRRGMDFGLLFCVAELAGVYARHGWTRLSPRKITRADEAGKAVPLPAKIISMCFPLCERVFPPGDADLRGPDW